MPHTSPEGDAGKRGRQGGAMAVGGGGRAEGAALGRGDSGLKNTMMLMGMVTILMARPASPSLGRIDWGTGLQRLGVTKTVSARGPAFKVWGRRAAAGSCLRLRGGISKPGLMDRFNPNQESWSDSEAEKAIEIEAERRAVESVMKKELDQAASLKLSAADQYSHQIHPSRRGDVARRKKVDLSEGMDVDSLVRAAQNIRLKGNRAANPELGQEELDAKLEEFCAEVQAELEGSSNSDDRYTMPDGMPVQEPDADIERQRNVDKRFNQGRMTLDEFERNVRADLRAHGIMPRDPSTGKIIKDKGPPLQALVTNEMDYVYPSPANLRENILQLIRTHIRNCRDPACEHAVGRDEIPWFEENLMKLNYTEQLAIWRQWEDIAKEETIIEPDNNPWRQRLIMGNYVPDSPVLEFLWNQGYNVTRCTVMPDAPACDLCEDFRLAGTHLTEGARNKLLAQHGMPVLVPEHYATVELAVTRSMSLTFFDNPRGRAWVRECRFLEDEEQYPMAEDFLKNPWCCDVAISPGVHDWGKPSTGVYDEGKKIEMLVREGRGPQGIYGLGDHEREKCLREENCGSAKDGELCYDEREALEDEVLLIGAWRMQEGTNGTVRGVHMLFDAMHNQVLSTVEVQDGPWAFELCDVRSIRGICVWCSDEDMLPINSGCNRQNCGKGPADRLREESSEDSDFSSGGVVERDSDDSGAKPRGKDKAQPNDKEFDDMQKLWDENDEEADAAGDEAFGIPEGWTSSELGSSSAEPMAAWPPCGFFRKPRDCHLTMTLCCVGGVADTYANRSNIGIVADARAQLMMKRCTVEDTYNGVNLIDASSAVWEDCLFQRNGVAICQAECSRAIVRDCRFANQRLANFHTGEPPKEISIHAVDGGKTGYGTIQSPEWGVGDDEAVSGDTLVKWQDTHLAMRDPQMTLVHNKADGSARMWFTERRPGSLRGEHRIDCEGCECERIICKYGCELQCVKLQHKGRQRDPARSGVCPILATENEFVRPDDNYSKLPADLNVDDVTKRYAEMNLKPSEMMGWERFLVDRYKRAKVLQERLERCRDENEKAELMRSQREAEEDNDEVPDEQAWEQFLERFGDTGEKEKQAQEEAKKARGSRRSRAEAKRQEEEESEEEFYKEQLATMEKEKAMHGSKIRKEARKKDKGREESEERGEVKGGGRKSTSKSDSRKSRH